jgi:dipeptidyl aminopeptidase/acylaminoacyl peptidase
MGLVSALVALTVLPASAHATFPGANGKIAFISFRDGKPEIYSVNPDGTGVLRLTNNDLNESEPKWSPDGTKIVFGTGINEDIWVMNADGTNPVALTPPASNDWSPAWSPDGTKIAFASCCPEATGIFVMNADGTGGTRVVTDFQVEAFLSWSPDGTRIAYTSGNRADGPAPYQIHVADGTSGTEQQVTFDDGYAIWPNWSPGGTKIAFSWDHYDLDLCGCEDIAVMNADGSNPVRVTDIYPDFQGHSETAPTWSPDGSKIAFSESPGRITVMNGDGSGQTPITNGTFDGSPDWQTIPLGPGPPATLTLSPETATNTLGEGSHCVTATVEDASGDPTPGITVTFTVTGATSAGGSQATDANGEAEFCYQGPDFPGTDQISASAEAGGPSDTATKTWVLPASTDGCRVNGAGQIRGDNGDRAKLENDVRTRNASSVKGKVRYTDRGPSQPFALESSSIDALTCADGSATIFGRAGPVSFRIDLADRGRRNRRDTYRIVLSSGYDSGTQMLERGDIRIRD